MAESLARLLTQLAVRRPWLVVTCGIAIAVAGTALATRLSLQTDLAELLPPHAPSVVALRALNQRVGGTGNVAIAIESKDGMPDPLRAYIPRLVDELRKELGTDLLSIKYSRKEVDEFYKKYAAYYVSLEQMTRWQHELAVALAKQNPAFVELDDQKTDPMRTLADEIRAAQHKLEPHNKADAKTGLLMTENGRLAVVFVRPASNSLNLAGADGMMDRIQRAVDATDPAGAGVQIDGYTGSIPLAISEVAAIRRDIVSTAILVILGVGGVVGLYFRGLRELFLMSGAVTIGTAVALGFAELWIGHVNAQTAFLGAIIVGTGINYGIIFLDRYRHARVVGGDGPDALANALERAFGQTLRATGVAALATAVSFGVLAAGEVESFHQFGWIGGIGILACWVATFTVVPACVVLADRGRRARIEPGFGPLRAAFLAIGRACERAPRRITAIALVAVAASVWIAVAARGHLIQTDLRKLGTKSAESSGIEELDNRLRSMDDRSATPAVIALDDRGDARPMCDVLNTRAKGDLHGVVRRCYSIEDLFAHDLDRRVPLMGKLRHDLDAVDQDDLAPDERTDLADLRRALDEAPPADRDLPPTLAEYFVERDGAVGKLAYVEPQDEHIESNLYRFTDAIRSIRLPSGKVIHSSGELVVFADVLRAMRRDATKLTIAAALLVLVVLGAVTRRLGTFLRVGGALCAGVAVMCGVAVLLGEKLNFFNFVALPTTFGIGIDYAINVEERIRQHGRAALARALAESGPAVLLASTTSMIGYASLLPADSRALASFGALAIIGELACVVVAVVLVPALWAARSRERALQ
ncbi:MAG TPA: MMPL family transporter [Kofleriaceae bacterium]|nr:MMPL family transporter [Kofleriaceae bacterium]